MVRRIFGKMGFLGIKTKKDREHEMEMQKNAQEHDERMRREQNESQ